MAIIKVKYIKVVQKNIEYYVCVLKAKQLKEMCSTSISNFDSENETYQRKLDTYRVNKISEFVKRDKGVMPTSIVLNANSKLVFDDDYLIIDSDKDSFFIIDGQHRIAGASEADEKYEFCVAIMNNIDRSFQSELFISINNEQKKVNSNVRFSMKANDDVKTPEKVYAKIAYQLNKDVDSPFYNRIKMNDYDTNRNKISISAFADGFIGYTYNSRDYYKLKDLLYKNNCVSEISTEMDYRIDESKYFLWKFYFYNKEDVLFKIIYNYFNAIRSILAKDWDDTNSIICKTTGYNALILLFKDIYMDCESNGNNFSYKYIRSKLDNIAVLSGQLIVEKCGLGRVASFNLYKEMSALISIEEKLDYDVVNNISDDEEM